MPVLRFGADSSIPFEAGPRAAPCLYGQPQGAPLADPAEAVRAALEQPLEYPPLRQSTTVGDRIVVALGQGVPRATEITAAVVHSLMAGGVDPDGISVLRTEADVEAGAGDPRRLVDAAVAPRIRLLTHDPANRQALGYLAANEEGDPILLNRLLVDADLVLPIGRLCDGAARGYFGIHGSIFPGLADEKTQSRFRRKDLPPGRREHHAALLREADQVAWLLGVNFTVQLLPAAGDGILGVVAGESKAVGRRGREAYRAAWGCPVARRASLVVAAIEGPQEQQTWENLGRALEAAGRLVEEGGAIAVCCELAARPGPAVGRLVGARSRGTAVRRILRDNPGDALPAAQLAHALERQHVYLLSRLDSSLVEDLDMVPIGGAEELGRLSQRHDSCILLANAPQVVVRLDKTDQPDKDSIGTRRS
jgi:nickel-dependent lactate racemase